MHTGEREYVHTGEPENELTVEGHRAAARGARAKYQQGRCRCEEAHRDQKAMMLLNEHVSPKRLIQLLSKMMGRRSC